MNPCELPPCPPCPPPPYPPCPQVCPPPPPPPLPPCRPKPNMRGLHWSQTKSRIFQALVLSALSGLLVYSLVGVRRRDAYKRFFENSEMEFWVDEMSRKGLFQGVPPESITDTGMKKK